MPFFESIGNFFQNTKDFFIGVKNKVVDTVSDLWNGGKQIVSGAIDTGKNVVTTLHDDVVGYAKGVKEIAQGAINKGGDVIVHGENVVGDIGKSFSWPLTIVGAGLGVYLLTKK